MPYLLARLLLPLVALLVAGTGLAQPVAAPHPITLPDSSEGFEVNFPVSSWLEKGSHSGVAVAATSSARFTEHPVMYRHGLTDQDTLWIWLRVLRPAGSKSQWTLNIPLPFVDAVTLYQSDGTGSWSAQMAGDTVAQALWNRKGMYPDFDLHAPSGDVVNVYLEIRNYKHLNVPLRFAAAPVREFQRLLESVVLGAVLGLLAAIALFSLVRYVQHRNKADAWAAVFGVLITVTVAQFNGVLNALLWTALPQWGNYGSNTIPVVALGATLLFVRYLYGFTMGNRQFDAVLGFVAWCTMGSVLSFLVLERSTADWIVASTMLCSVSAGLVAALLNLRAGSATARWLTMALIPQFLIMMWLLCEAFGSVPTVWELRYLVSGSVALSVPLLMHALNIATHDRTELRVRARHLPTQDALTGLLTPQAFQTHLEAAYERVMEYREPVALVLVSIINHEAIRKTFGDTTSENCLLRAVIKLHRILRDVDPAGRVGTARFALLIEGVATKEAVTERMVKLVASGLIPLPGLEPEVILQFHVACVMLHQNPIAPEYVLGALEKLLEGISPRTRRPIRFLNPEPTQAAGLPEDSVLA